MRLNKIIKIIIIFQVISVVFMDIVGQNQVKYGSNNGNYLLINQTKLYYETIGQGTPILLLHGGYGSISDFQRIIPILSKNYKLIIPDQPGLGRSDFPNDKLSYQLLSDYYSNFIDKLGLDSLFLIGWSDGGIIGLILSMNRQDKVRKLFVSGVNYKSDGLAKEFTNEMDKYTDTLWIEQNWKNWIKDYQSKTNNSWKRYVKEASKMWLVEQYFPNSDFDKIKIPTILIYGDHDLYTIEHGLEIHRSIKNSQFCVIPNCSHEVFLEKPELISQIALDFFK